MNNTIKKPDWQVKGSGLFDTVRRVKDKVVRCGFLQIELPCEFSDAFRYPIVIEVKSSGPVIESVSIAFIIDKDLDATRSTIEENVIVPYVLGTCARDNRIYYFAYIDEKQSKLSFYLNRKAVKLEN